MAKTKDITAFLSEEELKKILNQEISFLKKGIATRLELLEKIVELLRDESKGKKLSVVDLAQAIKLLSTELRNALKEIQSAEKILGKSRSELSSDDDLLDPELQELMEKATAIEANLKDIKM